MAISPVSGHPYTVFSRPSVASDVARNVAGALLRWSDRHSQVAQLSHEEMALRLANERVLETVHEGRFW